MKHDLKTWPVFFQSIWCGNKTFEIRKNDRAFKELDEITLVEYDPSTSSFSGRRIHGVITYITDFAQQPGYVVFAFRESSRIDA
jgi:hypothetical protein